MADINWIIILVKSNFVTLLDYTSHLMAYFALTFADSLDRQDMVQDLTSLTMRMGFSKNK